MLQDFFNAMYHGAALVYHDILAIESDVKQWETDNPKIVAFISEAVSAGNMFLAAHGVPALAVENAAEVAGTAVLSALKELAALDPTANSMATSTPTSTS